MWYSITCKSYLKPRYSYNKTHVIREYGYYVRNEKIRCFQLHATNFYSADGARHVWIRVLEVSKLLLKFNVMLQNRRTKLKIRNKFITTSSI
jgi:hypothetical protein